VGTKVTEQSAHEQMGLPAGYSQTAITRIVGAGCSTDTTVQRSRHWCDVSATAYAGLPRHHGLRRPL